jgi:IS5 family transposase
VAFQTGGFCFACARKRLELGLQTLDVAVEGGQVTVEATKSPQTARNRRKHLRRKDDPAFKRRRHASEKAKLAAMRRLAAACPELFALIHADERQKRGLAPISVRSALQSGPGEVAWATLDALAFYRSATSQEMPPDDPDNPTENPS